MVRFKFLSGDMNPEVYGGKWISNRQSNGEFDYYFVIELLNWLEAVGERDAPKDSNGKVIQYNVCLTVVSPQQAGEKKMEEAYSCCGIDDDMLANAKKNGCLAEAQVEALHGYAGGVPIWQSDGQNWRALMKEARKQAQVVPTLFGFYMDRPVNRMGENGWEALKLTDPNTVLERVCAEREGPATPEQRILGKMMGVQVE